jgi:hypothetical protein
MSLDRYTNKEEIIATNGKVRAIVWKDEELLQLDEKNVSPQEKPEVEIHLYTPGEKGRYIGGAILEDEDFELRKDEIFIEWASAASRAGVERGHFEAVVNVHKHILGDEEAQALYINEISADRRELHIKAAPNSGIDIEPYLDAWGEEAYRDVTYEMTTDENGAEVPALDDQGNPIVQSIIERPMSDDIALNFGQNKIFKIINQKDWDEENDFVVRLLHPLDKDIKVKDFLWIVEELADSYVDNINLQGGAVGPGAPRDLLGPNLEVQNAYGTVTETDFKNWNQLLDANLSTSQQIVDKMFSGSLKGEGMYGATGLGIDYTAFENFCHFSSAQERLKNFKYKLELVEYYDSRIALLNTTQGSDSSSLQGNVVITQKRKDNVIGSMDGFERWLYNEPTGTLATHGVTGSKIGADTYALTSYPKFLKESKYYLYSTTSSIAKSWYNGFLTTASLYDVHNESALTKTIPEHIRRDENNSEYELFVNMIGHHFDILYTYIDNLTQVYKPEEQPKLGQSKEVLYQVAESLGWKLSNGKQASSLWKYKLGVDSGSGKFQTTGSMFSKSDEEITTEVWRRTVNNLPYLLKSKGTTRSIKALMNTFGIPQTLLSIREYGGPKVSGDVPALIEDRFHYALTMNSGSFIQISNSHISSSIGLGQGGGADWGVHPGRGEMPVVTREFRFKPGVTSSMLLMSNYMTGSHLYDGEDKSQYVLPHWQLAIEHTGSYSGSSQWGRVHLSQGFASGSNLAKTNPMTGSSTWLPIYDGDFWNIRFYWKPSGSSIDDMNFNVNEGGHGAYNSGSNLDGDYYVQVQKASDYITGKVIHSASIKITPTNPAQYYGWSSRDDNQRIYLGGNTGSALITGSGWDPDPYNVNQFLTGSNCMNKTKMPGTFSGSIQEYREWLEVFDQRTFDLHTLNPTSYVSSITPTSSYDTLVRHYPLGTELNAVDHSQTQYKIISSSHPNNKQKDFSPPDRNDGYNTYASMSGFMTPVNAQRGNYHPYEETYYVQGISLGGVLPRSQKIRIENNQLVRQLDPLVTAERSRQDFAPIDTNRLGLFYSAADQINKEIFNNVGDVELDDFVGDPGDEYENDYKDLLFFSKGYWKKYSDRNDINAYIRIFSQFDFALFEQIKQTLPERVDEAMGIIVEPHALERAKYALTEPIKKEEPFYDDNIPYPAKEITGSYPVYEATCSKSYRISAHPTFPGDYGNTSRTGSRTGYVETTNTVAKYLLAGATHSADYCTGHIFAGGGNRITVPDRLDKEWGTKFPYNHIKQNMNYKPENTASICAVYNCHLPHRIQRVTDSMFALGRKGVPWGNTNPTALIHSASFSSAEKVGVGQVYCNISGEGNYTPNVPNISSQELRVQFDNALPYDTHRDIHIDVRHWVRVPGINYGSIAPSSSVWRTRLFTTMNNIHGMHPQYNYTVGSGATYHQGHEVAEDWIIDSGEVFTAENVLGERVHRMKNYSGTTVTSSFIEGGLKWGTVNGWSGYNNKGNNIDMVPFNHASSGSIRRFTFENVYVPAFKKLTFGLTVDGPFGSGLDGSPFRIEYAVGIGSIACVQVQNKVCHAPIQQQIY